MEQEIQDKQRSGWLKAARALLKLCLWVIGVMILLSFALHIPAVQQWSIRKVSTYFTDRLQTEVHIDRVSFNVFRHLRLEGVEVRDPFEQSDTLLYSEQLDLRFRNLFTLLNHKLTLKLIRLENASLHLKRLPDNPQSNLDLLLSRVASSGKKQEGLKKDRAGLSLVIRNLGLVNMQFTFDDAYNGTFLQIQLPEGKLGIRELDIDDRIVNVRHIVLDKPQIVSQRVAPAKAMDKRDLLSNVFSKESSWQVSIESLVVTDGAFKNMNTVVADTRPKGEGLDINRFDLTGIRVVIEDFVFMDGILDSRIPQITFREDDSGFALDKMSAVNFHMDSSSVGMEGLLLLTEHSLLQDSIALMFDDYSAFGAFQDEVTLKANLTDSRIGFRDMIYLVPGLEANPYFLEHKDDHLELGGNISGRLNRLRIDNLRIASKDIFVAGDIRTRDLTVSGQEFVNLDLNQARFPISLLEEVLPNLNMPPQFNTLGDISFSGNFDGFFKDFVAYGEFRSNIGEADLDIRLDLSEGMDKATYSGHIGLAGFHLGKWSGDPELGEIHAELEIKEGRGLTGEYAEAVLDGVIDRIGFKGYTYRNITLNGKLERHLFDGEATIHEDNVDLVFSGSVDFSDSIPSYQFQAAIDTLDLHALQITKTPLALSGLFDVDGSGNSLQSLIGEGHISDLYLSRDPGRSYRLDSLSLTAVITAPGERRISVNSEIVQGYIEGQYVLTQLPAILTAELKKNYPALFRKVNVNIDTVYAEHDFVFDLYFKEPQNWIEFAGLDAFFIRELDLSGAFSSISGDVNIRFRADAFGYKNFNMYGVAGDLQNQDQSGSLSIDIIAGDISENYVFEDISLRAMLLDSSVNFDLSMQEVDDFFDTLRIPGNLDILDDTYRIHLLPSNIQILDRTWTLEPDNAITIGKNTFDLEGLSFVSDDQFFSIKNYKRHGLQFDAGGFDAEIINEIWNYDKLHFEGAYELFFQIEDISKNTGLRLDLKLPALTINDMPYGALDLTAVSGTTDPALDINLSLQRDAMNLNAVGKYSPPFKTLDSLERNVMDLSIAMTAFPLQFFEFILGDGIHSTVGNINGNITLSGQMGDLSMGGDAVISNGATTIDILGTRYFFDQQEVTLTDTKVDMTGAVISDGYGNTGTITGGLTHRRFKYFGLNARIQGSNMQVLNTDKQDNPMYYGSVFSNVDARFTGPMARPNIVVSGETSSASSLFIPLDISANGDEEDFLQFVRAEDTAVVGVTLEEVVPITGVSLEMDISVNTNAIIELIFNERTGDIIRSAGNGNIRMLLSREGEFLMYGSYEIDEGTYLFTHPLATNKPFVIRRGSTIQWSGDPFDAQIRVRADYIGLRTSLTTFLAEYLVNAPQSTVDEARLQTEVDLTLLLSGSLHSPEISFNIDFPNVTGELSGYLNSKMRILESNPNALNEQVFGLLWAGTFLPSSGQTGQPGVQSTFQTGLFNTVTEFFANQMSRYLSSFLEGAFQNVGFISGVDVDIGYDNTSDYLNDDIRYREYEFSLKNRLFNDRVVVDVGGNYVEESPVGENYFAGDFAVEYVLTKDRRLKVRFSHRNDQTIEGRKKYKYGIGLSYRREFDSFYEFLHGVEKDVEKVRNQGDSGSQ